MPTDAARFRRRFPLVVVALAVLIALPGGSGAPPTRRPSPATPAAGTLPSNAVPRIEARSSEGPAPGPGLPFDPASATSHPPSLGPDRPAIAPHAWHGLGAPPGAEVLDALGAGAHPSADGGTWGDLAQWCYGIFPSREGQAAYLPGCYGADEPGITGYSALPGSGGNVTWTTTLPIGTSDGAMQSDLYSAVWYGMPLTDPYAWLDVCFLELQLYPDSSWTSSGTALNEWVGAAVGWQLQASSFEENPCYYQPLTVVGSGSEYLDLSGGDRVVVRMTGWSGDAAGEFLQVIDATTHTSAALHLYNATGRYALDPAYSTASYPNSLEWTPGGELPVTFAFETGHGAYPIPNNNSYGGCSAGWPPSRPTDPSVPCPSYDPGSWINDTASPYEISPPSFFNASASATATQVEFTQDLGGIAYIDPISNGSCDGRDGSAWCSYPWYSYSCATHAFEFGATDWPNTSADFGKFGEFAQTPIEDRAGLSFYPPTNASVPACGAPDASIEVGASAGGWAYLLNASYASNATVAGLLPGTYSLGAIPAAGESFEGWTVAGGAAVADASLPATTLSVRSNGSAYARFGPSPPASVDVRFDESNATSAVQLVPGVAGNLSGLPPPARTIADGASVDLVPGIYSIDALPAPGRLFSNWSIAEGNATLAAPDLPFTWLTVPGRVGPVVVQLTTAPSADRSTLYLLPFATAASYGSTGNASGAIVFNGSSTVRETALTVPVGSYPITERPSAGSVFSNWAFGGDVATLDFANTSWVTLAPGPAVIEGAFSIAVNVTLDDAGGLGDIDLNGSGWAGSGTIAPLLSVPVRETLAADPPAGERFDGWTASAGANLSVADPGSAFTTLLVNGSGVVTAHYASATAVGLAFAVAPGPAGSIALDGASYGNGSSDAQLAPGLYLAQFAPGSLESLRGWTLTGPVLAASDATLGWPSGAEIVNVSGTGATLKAAASARAAPVTFLAAVPSGVGPSFAVNGTAVPEGGTVDLAFGPVPVRVAGSLPAGRTVRGWTASGGVAVVGGNASGATLFVNGSGTLNALLGPVLGLNATATPQITNASRGPAAPLAVAFGARASGGRAPYRFNWSFGDGGNSTVASPSHTYEEPGVYAWSVLATDSGGNATHVSGVVVVGGPPLSALARASPVLGEPPLTVEFRANASGGAPPYADAWWFPALGTTASGSVANATFDAAGTFTGVLNVTDAEGFVATSSVVVTVASPLTIEASASRERGEAPLNVSFAAAAFGGWGSSTFRWSFGDGTFGNGSSVAHEYLAVGNFTANVTATDALDYTASSGFTIAVVAPPLPLAVRIAAAPANLTLGDVTTISATATGGVPPYSFSFRSDDGVPPGCSPPPSSGVSGSYACTPSATGTFRLLVNVTDDDRHSATNATLVVVNPAPLTAPRSNRSSTGTGPLGLPPSVELLLIGVVVAAGIAAAILVATRRPPEPPEESRVPTVLEDEEGPTDEAVDDVPEPSEPGLEDGAPHPVDPPDGEDPGSR